MKLDHEKLVWRLLGILVLTLTLMGAAHPFTHADPGRHFMLKPHVVNQLVKTGSVDWSKLPVITGHASTATTGQRTFSFNGDPLTPAQRQAFYASLKHVTFPKPTTLASMPRSGVGASVPNPNFDACGYNDNPCLAYSHAGLTSAQANSTRPDPTIASNPSYVLEGVNYAFVVYSFNGGVVSGPISSSSFFGSIFTSGDAFGEPQVFWDATRLHWVIEMIEVHFNGSGFIDAGWYDVAVSKSQNVTLNPATQYHLYKFSADFGIGSTGHNWCNYPTLGSDYWGLYLACAAYDSTSNNFQGTGVLALSKNDLYSGAATVYSVSAFGIGGFRLSPALEDGTPDAEFVLSTDEGLGVANDASLTICAFVNTRALATHSAFSGSCLGVSGVLSVGYTDPVYASEPNAPNTINTGFGTTQVEYKNGALYFAMTSAISATNDGVIWAEVTPQLTGIDQYHPQNQQMDTITVRQDGLFALSTDGITWVDVYLPTLTASTEDDLALVMTYSNTANLPGILYVGRRGSDVLGAMPGSSNLLIQPMIAGSNDVGSGSMGYYSSCSLDTNLTSRGLIWCVSQYGGADASQNGTGWDTWIYGLRTS